MTNQKLLKELKKIVRKHAGTKCKDFNIHCYTCVNWLGYDIIESLFEDIEHYEKENTKKES